MTHEQIDELWPPCGPCAFCGGPDKRHRMFDAIRDRHRAGETLASIAADYMTDIPHVLAALAWTRLNPTPDDAMAPPRRRPKRVAKRIRQRDGRQRWHAGEDW